MRYAALTAIAVLVGAAAVSAAGAAPGTAAVRYRAVATEAKPGVVPAGRAGAGWRGGTIIAPGSRTANAGGFSDVSSVWCGSAGNCTAGGDYPASQGSEGFVARQRRGTWGREIEVPGLAALNRGRAILGVSVSCGSAGNCAVGGDYTDRLGDLQGFVASEKNGVWDKAVKMPGSRLSIPGGVSDVVSVSCGSAGNCAVGGDYTDRRNRAQAFVVSHEHGTWAKPVEVPGLGALNTHIAETESVSCASAGNCAAGGYYTDRSDNLQGFVVSERNGRWGNAVEVPGLGALNAGGYAEVVSVSCGSAGNCVAGGDYTDRRERDQGFVVSMKHGVWGKAIEVPGLGALNAGSGGLVGTASVSCWSAGNCAADGDYTDRSGDQLGFVASERNGVWGKAIKVRGLAALNTGRDAEVSSVSCGSAGTCVVGGFYTVGRDLEQGFVVSERKGVWGRAVRMPGRGALDAEVTSVWCASARYCAAGGYSIHSITPEFSGYGFVVSERSGIWGKPARIVPPGSARK